MECMWLHFGPTCCNSEIFKGCLGATLAGFGITPDVPYKNELSFGVTFDFRLALEALCGRFRIPLGSPWHQFEITASALREHLGSVWAYFQHNLKRISILLKPIPAFNSHRPNDDNWLWLGF